MNLWRVTAVLLACVLGYLLASGYEPPKMYPARSLRHYLYHSYEASTGSEREREAFKKVFNGKQKQFAGIAEKMYTNSDYDHFVITLPNCSFWLLLLARPGEFENGWIEFDCKIREFNVAESLAYYRWKL